MIAIVTDSSSQLSTDQAAQLSAHVVPLVISIDDVDYAEGVDIDADGFYEIMATGEHRYATSQPSPGRFLDAYRAAAEGGASEIISVHIGSEHSGTVNSASLAARRAPVPVRVIDTGTASYGVALCVERAAEIVAAGGSAAEAETVIEAFAPTIESVFIVQALDLARSSGRLRVELGTGAEPTLPVLATKGPDLTVVGSVTDLDSALDTMAGHILARGQTLRVALSIADRESEPLWQGLRSRLEPNELVIEMTDYRVGPSVAAHLGRGTAGAFFTPSTILEAKGLEIEHEGSN